MAERREHPCRADDCFSRVADASGFFWQLWARFEILRRGKRWLASLQPVEWEVPSHG